MDGLSAACQIPGSLLPGWSWGTLPNSHSNLPTFVYSVDIYRCPLGTLVALETKSHSGLKQGDQGLNVQSHPNMITALAPPRGCSGPSPICSGASETRRFPPPLPAGKPVPGSLEVFRKTPAPPLIYRVALSGLCHLSSHIPLFSPHPHPATLAFLLFLKYSYFASNHRAFALAVFQSGMPFHPISPWLVFSDHLGLCLNVTSSERPFHTLSYLLQLWPHFI